MQSNALRRVGVVLTYIVPGSNAEEYDPTVKAGWRQYVPALPFHDDTDMTKEFPHVIRLTQEGLDVIDNWRSAQGYVSLDEQWRLNKERDEAVRHA